MKALFLDIDGVLNHEDFFVKRAEKAENNEFLSYPLDQFDPLCVERVNRILDETEAKLIISSSWRFTKGLDNILTTVGFKHPIHDTTPYIPNKIRGEEIDLWLNNHKDFDRYVILDDDKDFLRKQKPYFVHTSRKDGLTDKLTEKAIRILNN